MLSWLARHPIAGFLAFSHGWTFAFYALAGLIAVALGASVWGAPAAFAFYLGVAGVMLGGLVMSFACGGRAGLRDLLRRCVDPRRIGALWWAVIFFVYPVLTVLAAGIAAMLGLEATLRPDHAARILGDVATGVVFFGFILLIGPLPEEIGWRGFLLDRLLARASALAASLWLALAWWAWHIPLPHLPGYFEVFTRAPPGHLAALIALVPTALLHTWLYVNTAAACSPPSSSTGWAISPASCSCPPTTCAWCGSSSSMARRPACSRSGGRPGSGASPETRQAPPRQGLLLRAAGVRPWA